MYFYRHVFSVDVPKEVQVSVNWLQTNQEPFDIVQGHWKATYPIRLESLTEKSKGEKIGELIETWPILRHPMGWMLIQQDFDNFGFCSVEKGIDQWPEFFGRVKQACFQDKSKIPRVKELCDILEKDLDDGIIFIISIDIL